MGRDEIWEIAGRLKKNLSDINDRNDWTLKARLKWLKRLDYLIADNKDNLLAVIAAQKGVSEHQVLQSEYFVVRSLCRYYLRRAEEILAPEDRSRELSPLWANKKALWARFPIGVVGIITASNYPFSLALDRIIPAILTGNAVIWKPAPETSAVNGKVEKIVKASLAMDNANAAGLFDTLPTDIVSGQNLVRCPAVDKIHATCSAETARWIKQEDAKIPSRFVAPTLEGGGSNAAIVLEDADLYQAARVITWARFSQATSCNAIKRVLAVEQIYEPLCELLEELALILTPDEREPLLERHRDNYNRFLNDYSANYPFSRQANQDSLIWQMGWPQILRIENLANNLAVWNEETFVPLLPVVKVRDAAEAIELANKSDFGLGGSVFTNDKKAFYELAGKLQCGGVFRNDAMTEYAQVHLPFGGWKNSGWGWVHGREGLLDFTIPKLIVDERWAAPRPYFPWTGKKRKRLRRFANFLIRLS